MSHLPSIWEQWGGVMFVRLNELYSFTMLTLAGSCLGGSGGGTPVGGGGITLAWA